MQQTTLLTTDTLLRFVNKHRTELRPMPLSHELHKLLLHKRELPEETIYEMTQQLLQAEKKANAKQKNIFKHIDSELNIPYQKAKELDKEGKLTHASFRELLGIGKK